MKLRENQLNLIRHLIRFHVMDYDSCLEMLDTENTGDRIAMSYAFRPLTKNGYLSKNKDNIVSIRKKGRALFPDEQPLISNATGEKARQRVLQVSRVAMWMEKNGVTVSGKLMDTEEPYFIPSACWRNIANGILSTTRFAGVLLAYGRKYAVYDIGDGSMEWQIRAESSLFYRKYGSYETKADGMILICEDGKREEIAQNIIRQTMWNRKSLLKDRYSETDKPVRYSRAPIKLRAQYEHVYLTTPARLAQSLERIYDEEYYIANSVEGGSRLTDPKLGDVEVWPNRYFLNPAFDLLKLVYFFSAVKEDMDYSHDPGAGCIQFILVVHREDLEVAGMYSDVNKWKEARILAYRSAQNDGEN